MSMGEFQGGNLWVEDYGEDHLPAELQDSGKTLKGKIMPVGQWNSFDPRHKHGVTKVSKGVRVSISLYTPTRLAALSDDLWQELRLLVQESTAEGGDEVMMAPSKVWKAGILKPELAYKEPPEKIAPAIEAEKPPEKDTTPPKVEVVTPEELELPEEVSDLEKALTQVSPVEVVAWETHVKAGHQPKRADCLVCQQADGVRVVHKTTSDERKAMRAGTMYLDVGHMHAADSIGRKSFVSGTVRLTDQSGKTMVLPWFEPVPTANGTEVVKVISKIVASLPALRPLRMLHGLVVHTIFSDKGTEFINKQVEKFCQDQLICHLQSPPYQHSSNGLAEVM
eukprot:1472973-Amphidinium_carterae.1